MYVITFMHPDNPIDQVVKSTIGEVEEVVICAVIAAIRIGEPCSICVTDEDNNDIQVEVLTNNWEK